MNKYILNIGLVIISAVTGFLLWELFLKVSLAQFQIDNIRFAYRKLTTQFLHNIIFAVSFGLIPILYLLVNKIAKLELLKHRLINLVLIILSGLVFWLFRILHFTNQFDFNSDPLFENIESIIYIEDLRFELHILIGLIIGSVISLIIFGSINRYNDNKRKVT